MLIAQLSDIHVGGSRYRPELLHAAISEINAASPDLVVVAGDVTDDGYPDQYPEAKEELAKIECTNLVVVPGNHDARNVGYLRFEEEIGHRDSQVRLEADGLGVEIVAVDSSKPDIDEGEVGREHYGWIEEGFSDDADLRVDRPRQGHVEVVERGQRANTRAPDHPPSDHGGVGGCRERARTQECASNH